MAYNPETRNTSIGCEDGLRLGKPDIRVDALEQESGRQFTRRPQKDYFDFLRQDFNPIKESRYLGYVNLDANGIVRSANFEALEILGVERKELIRTDIFQHIFAEDRWKNKLAGKGLAELANRSFDLRPAKKPDPAWIRMSIIVDGDAFFCQSQIHLILQDITHEKQTEKENEELRRQLRQTQKMETIGEFSGGIVHDLNNFLQPIIGSLEILIDDAGHNPKLKKALEKILAGTNRAGSLVKQILNFSHRCDSEIAPVRIQPIIQEVLKLSRSTLPPSINIIQTLDNDCGPVVADPTHIYQIVMNLLTNALHAMGSDGGILKVCLKEAGISGKNPGLNPKMPPGRFACLDIFDTGAGIDAEIIDKIFDPYFTTKETGSGTGLGLSVIHRIVKRYGGDIHVSSTPGQGSHFQICLPCEPVALDSKETVPEEEKNLYGHESILFVDDDPFIVDVQQATLERYGYTVISSNNGRDALDKFKEKPDRYDLVVCDMSMPSVTGLDLSHQVKMIRPNIPVVICTGFSEQVNQKNYIEMGVDGFLMKPVNKQECLELIRRLLDER